MARTVVGLFDTREAAQRAVSDLVDGGVPRADISLVAADPDSEYMPKSDRSKESGKEGSGIGTNTAAGAVFGGLGGLLLGLGALAIPGIGPIVAAGPIAAALAGAGIGAAGGAMIGALKESGIPEEEAHFYAESVRRGGTVVIARMDDTLADPASEIMDKNGAVDVEERVASYRQGGWREFGETSESPQTFDEGRVVTSPATRNEDKKNRV